MIAIRFAIVTALTLPLSAVELSDLAGDWTLAELDSPVGLKENYYNDLTMTSRTSVDSRDFAKANEFLTYAYYPDPLHTRIRSFNLSPSGTVSGGETGQVINISSNRLTYFDDELTTVYSNTSGDLLLASGRDSDRQNQTLCLKRPATLTTAEFAGNWFVASVTSPNDISTNVVEGRLADTYFIGESQAVGGNITIAPGGNFSGLFTGSITANGPGDATLTTADGSIPFKVNASKNVSCGTRGDGEEQELIVLVRKPATLTTAELAGTWRISIIQIPTTLTESFYNIVTEQQRDRDSADVAQANEILVDVFHKDRFELERLQVLVNADGTFTGPGAGTMTASGVNVSVFLDGETTTLHPSADKNFMVGVGASADSQELILCVKTSDEIPKTFAEAVDLKVVPQEGMMVFSWNSASNVALEEAGSLTGWDRVEEAEGGDSFVVDPSDGGSRFYRLAEKPPAE